jgi:filamentous hemagglutinin
MRATASILAVVMYLSPLLALMDEAAQAAPIVDPRAPIPFQPAITQTSTGIPAVNIATPNANGISVNSYQSFNVDSGGLVLNNSLVPGTPLLGGTLGANPNLAGRAASTIVNQVSSTGSASTLLGILEVFGIPASVIISNPNGVSVNGLALTNVPNLVLTTGTPQFLTSIGGTPTTFPNAGALAYSVSSGNITINGPSGVNGPGAGIEGTVGNIDLIAQTINLNAPLLANDRVNLITGNQLVSPTASDSTGTTYGTTSNGTTNTSAAIGNGGVAIDASQYGSVTSGQIFIVSTPAGMGVNTQGALAATAGNINVSSNGDITVGNTFASQNVNLSSAGNTTITGTALANQNYTVAANGNVYATGSVAAGQSVSLNAGGDLNATSVAAAGSANLTAGGSMTLGSLSANSLDLQATNGNLTLNQSVTAPGAITAVAGQNLTINGAVQGGSTVTLTGGQNASVNGSLSGVGNTSVAATSGNVNIAGTVQTNATFTATAGQDATLGGTLTAPGAIAVTTGQDASIGGDATSGATLTVTAGGNATVQGAAASLGDMSLAANGGTLTTTGSVTSLGVLTASGQQGVSLGGTVYSQGNAQISSAARSVAVAGTLTSPGAIGISAAQDVTVTGFAHSGGDTTVTASRDANLNGGLEVDGTGNATVTAGRDINGNGAVILPQGAPSPVEEVEDNSLTVGTAPLVSALAGGSGDVTNSVSTPHGLAVQSTTPESLAALQQAQNGATLYRAGSLGVQNTADAQFWSFENPLANPQYASQMGMPGSDAPAFDWVMTGNLHQALM